jgi:hypothetical protein
VSSGSDHQSWLNIGHLNECARKAYLIVTGEPAKINQKSSTAPNFISILPLSDELLQKNSSIKNTSFLIYFLDGVFLMLDFMAQHGKHTGMAY